MEKAKDWLRQKGMAPSPGQGGTHRQRRHRRSLPAQPRGAPPKQGALVEINCESDFVAKTRTSGRSPVSSPSRSSAPGRVGSAARRFQWSRRAREGDLPCPGRRQAGEHRGEDRRGQARGLLCGGLPLDQPWIKDGRRKKSRRSGHRGHRQLGEKVSVAASPRFEVGETGETARRRRRGERLRRAVRAEHRRAVAAGSPS